MVRVWDHFRTMLYTFTSATSGFDHDLHDLILNRVLAEQSKEMIASAPAGPEREFSAQLLLRSLQERRRGATTLSLCPVATTLSLFPVQPCGGSGLTSRRTFPLLELH